MGALRTTVQDVIEHSLLRFVFFTRHAWLTVVFVMLVALAMCTAVGWLTVEFGPVPVAALLCGLGYAFWALNNIEMGYWAVIGLIALLPFASLPFSIGFTPTFLDLALGLLFATWVLPLLLGEEDRVVTTPLGGPVLAFALLAIVAFVAGLSHGPLTSYLIRHFAEVLLSIAVFYLVVNTVQDVDRLERVVRILILVATVEAAIGIGLYLLPDDWAITVLSALGRFKYPVGPGVLRFIRDDPALMKRATATSVDPNVLGSLLNVTLALAIPQLFAERPIIRRGLLIPMMGAMALCLGLTVSRGSMFGVVGAAVALAMLRYRKLWPLMGVGLVALLLLPWTQAYVTHFIEGIQLQDLSTRMRLGEYKDAFILIRRYPFLGVGFAGAPDIDIYIGVANVYLLIAEQMGLVGLGAFLVIVFTLFARFWRGIRSGFVPHQPRLEPLWYGVHAAVLGGLLGGVLDHYFFSLDFHHSVTLFWLLIGLATAATELVLGRLALSDS